MRTVLSDEQVATSDFLRQTSSPVIVSVWKDCRANSQLCSSFLSRDSLRMIPVFSPTNKRSSFGMHNKVVILPLNSFNDSFRSVFTYKFLAYLESAFS